MTVVKISKQKLLDADVLDAALEDVIIGVSRWSVRHRIVFEYEGRHYQTAYSRGATEAQDERPWEYTDEVECTPVELRDVVVKKWVAVE